MIKKKKLVLIVATLLILIIAILYSFNKSITGNVIVEGYEEDGCIFYEYEYDGTFIDITNIENNSYINIDNFTFEIKTDYWGESAIENCSSEETSDCPFSITFKIKEDFGEKDIVQIGAINGSKTNTGNQTINFKANCSEKECAENNYTIKVEAAYSCSDTTLGAIEKNFGIDKTFPNITSIYPQNDQTMNISQNETITIFPTLNATDSIGISSKKVYYGKKIIDIFKEENITLTPGNYTWKFEAVDYAGNAKQETIEFRIINDSHETPIIHNATIMFGTNTPENNKITNTTSILFEISSESDESEINTTLEIFDSDGQLIRTVSNGNKTLSTTHTFTKDGNYKYNATITTPSSTKKTETRSIIIDTKKPTIKVVSPKNKNESFVNQVVIEFSAEDENGISRKWINNKTKDIVYSSKMNFTLDKGSYEWTIYAEDNAGNTAKENIKFSIKKTSAISTTIILIILGIIIFISLLTFLLYTFFIKKKNEDTQGRMAQMPPQNPGFIYPPINPQNNFQPTFKNNQTQGY